MGRLSSLELLFMDEMWTKRHFAAFPQEAAFERLADLHFGLRNSSGCGVYLGG
jgi:hypothetical protein